MDCMMVFRRLFSAVSCSRWASRSARSRSVSRVYAPFLDGAVHHHHQFVGNKRLDHKIECPHFRGLDDRPHGGQCRHHDADGAGLQPIDSLDKLKSIHSRHLEIDQHQRIIRRSRSCRTPLRRWRPSRPQILAVSALAVMPSPHAGLILDDQDLGMASLYAHDWLSSACTPFAGRMMSNVDPGPSALLTRDLASMHFDDPIANGKSESGALADRLCAEERAEDMFQVFGRNSRTLVPNRDDEIRAIASATRRPP